MLQVCRDGYSARSPIATSTQPFQNGAIVSMEWRKSWWIFPAPISTQAYTFAFHGGDFDAPWFRLLIDDPLEIRIDD